MNILRLQELRPVVQEGLLPIHSQTSSWYDCCRERPPVDGD